MTRWMAISSLVAAGLVACSNAPPDDAPDYEIDMTSAQKPAQSGDDTAKGSGAEQTNVEPQAAPSDAPSEDLKGATTYAGTLATTAKVTFGGAPYCTYDVTLKNVSLMVSMTADDKITGATLKDRMVEGAPGCSQPPQPASDQSFDFKAQSAITNGTRLTFTGAADNHPKTDLVVDLIAAGEGYDASATWKRTDQTGSLAWTVKGKITLSRK